MSNLSIPTVSSGFARLLATENISVRVDSSAPTAAFNVESRELIMPVWENMSEQLTDMLLGHEVSHALHTTDDDLLQTVKTLAKNAGVPEQVAMNALNVVEDVRIDRLIQRKYRGLVSDYAAGYPEMREMNLFEIKEDEDINERSFLDRMNLNAKAYNGEVMFTNEERTLVERAENTETYEEVLELTADVLDLMKQQRDENQENQPEEESDSGDVESGDDAPQGSEDGQSAGEQSQDTGDEGDETENNASGDTGEQQGDETAEGGEDGVETKGEGTMESAAEGEDDGSTAEGDQQTDTASNGWDDVMAKSADAMAKNLQEMAKQEETDYYKDVGSNKMPTGITDEAVLPVSETRKRFADSVSRGHISQRKIKKLSDSAADLRPTVNAMAMAFTRKQAAHIARRTQVAKSGRLDMNKLVNYKLTEDIFLKTQQRPDGKNHALTVVIDWSGSMNGKCQSTIKQAVTLAMFCKKVNVPCEVYLFTSEYDVVFKDGTIENNAKLLQILDTSVRNNLFNQDVTTALFLGESADDYRMFTLDGFNLGSTPLGAALTISKFTHQSLMARTNAEVGNIIFLTDGQGDHGVQNRGSKAVVVTDPISRRSYTAQSEYGRNIGQMAICDWIRGETGSKVINFFMTGKREGQNMLEYSSTPAQRDQNLKTWKKERWGLLSQEKAAREGWDAAFVVYDNAATDVDDAMDNLEDDASKAKIRSAYVKSLQGRAACRPLVEKITDFIAA